MNFITRLCLIAVSMIAIASCAPRPVTPEEHALKVILQHPQNSYENFVTQGNYPSSARIYFNEKLMRKASSRSPIYICLLQQRARLYVNGEVAADWPVSTGTSSHPTPAGNFTIVEKKASHSSSLWGRLYGSGGKLISSNADSRKAKVPAGGKFVGASMPYWQRLTWDGIGMHVGRVIPGRRLSHGCIRMPRQVAQRMFRITSVGRTRVYVVRGIEKQFPASARTSMRAQVILKNYRNYAKKQGNKKKIKLTPSFAASQKALASQLPSLSNFKHIDVTGVSPLDTSPKLKKSSKASKR